MVVPTHNFSNFEWFNCTENIRLHYEDQMISAIEYFNVKAGDTYSNHCALNS
jgi:hypothetical protein